MTEGCPERAEVVQVVVRMVLLPAGVAVLLLMAAVLQMACRRAVRKCRRRSGIMLSGSPLVFHRVPGLFGDVLLILLCS
jgi:hypothetical protein